MATTNDNYEPLRIERFTMRGRRVDGPGALDYATSGDMAIHLKHHTLYAGESGTVLVALDIDGMRQTTVTVDEGHDPLEQLDRAVESLLAVRDRLASLLALADPDLIGERHQAFRDGLEQGRREGDGS